MASKYKKTIVTSWKTTSAGVLSILTGLIRYYIHFKSGQPMTEEVLITTITGIITGVGLLVAKDSNVTGSPAQNVEEVTTLVKPKPADTPPS